ncbi:MAG: SPOR domain-containing protein [Rudaea sp.]|uniref:SPOR domain-containing protein n=1 Tax=Rudaea sp. TaxID=2136325 RepID=UPI0039E69C24
MAKRNSQASRNGDRRQTPAWAMVLLGVVLGVVGSALVLYGGKIPTLRGGKNLPQPNPEAVAPKESEKSLAEEAAKPPPAPPKSNYDFYTALPEKEVVIPDAELSAKAKAEQQRAKQQAQTNAENPAAPTTTTPSSGGGRYMLQVTATSDAAAAEALKAKLAMLGFSAKVYTSNVDGKTLHRVRLGPFATASETELSKRALAENSINAIPVKEAN